MDSDPLREGCAIYVGLFVWIPFPHLFHANLVKMYFPSPASYRNRGRAVRINRPSISACACGAA